MWVVDTCVVLDVFEHDPDFGLPSAKCLEKLLPDGLCVSPVTMVELAAEAWTSADTAAAHLAWHTYVQARRAGDAAKRPVADLLIGGFALNRDGLVTRNPKDFKRWFPKLSIREPRT